MCQSKSNAMIANKVKKCFGSPDDFYVVCGDLGQAFQRSIKGQRPGGKTGLGLRRIFRANGESLYSHYYCFCTLRYPFRIRGLMWCNKSPMRFTCTGILTLLLDESYTSKRCYFCRDKSWQPLSTVSPFKMTLNLREKTRVSTPYKLCWGLVKCCQCERFYDRDLNACRNIRYLARHILAGNIHRPLHLSRLSSLENRH